MVVEEYKYYYICYNVYNSGEYTVQIDGDDVWFDTIEEARKCIDENAIYEDEK